MSNRFCVILNQENNLPTTSLHPPGMFHSLRQGKLFIGGGTPYKTYNQGNESWHIIGHIDNLPLLNYLLFNYYPTTSDLIKNDIIGLAVSRYGMSIIQLLKGSFCIIHENAEGDLTLITEEDDEISEEKNNIFNYLQYDKSTPHAVPPIAGAPQTDSANGAHEPQGPDNHKAVSDASKPYEHIKYAQRQDALPACNSPAAHYSAQGAISVTRWRDNHLQFIKTSLARSSMI